MVASPEEDFFDIVLRTSVDKFKELGLTLDRPRLRREPVTKIVLTMMMIWPFFSDSILRMWKSCFTNYKVQLEFLNCIAMQDKLSILCPITNAIDPFQL